MNDRKILLLSDRPENGSAISALLHQIDMVVVESRTGFSLPPVHTNEDYHLIIVDDQTGRSEQLEICRKLRIRFDAPILILTHYQSECHQMQIYEIGADECIVKPISQELLLAKTRAWIRWYQPNHRRSNLLQSEANAPNVRESSPGKWRRHNEDNVLIDRLQESRVPSASNV